MLFPLTPHGQGLGETQGVQDLPFSYTNQAFMVEFAFEFQWISGEKERFGVSLGFQIRHFIVAVMRENFGALRGLTDFQNEL